MKKVSVPVTNDLCGSVWITQNIEEGGNKG